MRKSSMGRPFGITPKLTSNECITSGLRPTINKYYLLNDTLNTFKEQLLLFCSFEGRKEGNVLFNDTLNTFYLRLYGVKHMVKDHSDSERGNRLLPHGLLSPIDSKGSFICTTTQTRLHILRPLLHQSWSTGWNEK